MNEAKTAIVEIPQIEQIIERSYGLNKELEDIYHGLRLKNDNLFGEFQILNNESKGLEPIGALEKLTRSQNYTQELINLLYGELSRLGKLV